MMRYNILASGYIKNQLAVSENGVKSEKLLAVTNEINTAIVSINTKSKSLAFALATVKTEKLYTQGKGWPSYEAYCREWGISKSDASRFAAVGALLSRDENGALRSVWGKKTKDFSFSALCELVTVPRETVDAWLDDGTLTLNATVAACRKAKKSIKTDDEKPADEKPADVDEKPADEKPADVAIGGASKVAYIQYRDAMRNIVDLIASGTNTANGTTTLDVKTIMTAIKNVDKSVAALAKLADANEKQESEKIA